MTRELSPKGRCSRASQLNAAWGVTGFDFYCHTEEPGNSFYYIVFPLTEKEADFADAAEMLPITLFFVYFVALSSVLAEGTKTAPTARSAKPTLSG